MVTLRRTATDSKLTKYGPGLTASAIDEHTGTSNAMRISRTFQIPTLLSSDTTSMMAATLEAKGRDGPKAVLAMQLRCDLSWWYSSHPK